MLLVLLFFSVVGTFWCIYAEFQLRNEKEEPKPTPVMVEMNEDNDFDGDPPTVVAHPRIVMPDVTRNHRIETSVWSMVSPSLRPLLLRSAQFLTWLASL
jgi:hypothetical protein